MNQEQNGTVITETDALLEWVNSCPSIKTKYYRFIDLKDGISISLILNDIDPDYFHLVPLDYPRLSNEDCLENLKNIIRSIIYYYDKTRGWELESNIPLSNIFLKDDPQPLVLILRWVITTILFCDKKTEYITTILSLTPDTQYYLQCIIETVMNAFPQDEANSSAVNDLHSILEESSITLNDNQQYDSVLENSRLELRHRFEDEIQQLESRIIQLQQSLSSEKEESDSLRRQRDELQREVGKLEADLREQREIVAGLEGQERRLSLAAEDTNFKSSERIRTLEESNRQLTKKVDLFSSENEQFVKEVEFLRQSKKDENEQHSLAIKQYEEEIKKLRSELEVLSAEKDYLQKSAEKAEVLQQRLDTLKDIETKYTELKREHEELQLHFAENQVSLQDEVSRDEIKRLREDAGMLRGRLEASLLERKDLQTQAQQLQSENRQLREELQTVKRNVESSPAPVSTPSASLENLMKQPEMDAENKAKMRKYIVENSELRLQLQKERKQHEESLRGKDEEYKQSRSTLEEEFSKKIRENRELREVVQTKEEEVRERDGTIADLQEVVSSQKDTIETQSKKMGEQEAEISDWRQRYESLTDVCEQYKRKCSEFEKQAAEDQRKRRQISTIIYSRILNSIWKSTNG